MTTAQDAVPDRDGTLRTFGARLRDARRARGMTQADLAAAAGAHLHQSGIVRIEAGARPAVRLTDAVALAAVLGVSLSELLDEDAAARQLRCLADVLPEVAALHDRLCAVLHAAHYGP